VATFYYLSGKRGVTALEKYSLAVFYYLGGKRGVAALEKYSLAAFYYLGGKRGVTAHCTSQEHPTLSYHRDSKMLPNYTSQEQPPLS
jgi:hypothetical protein